MAARGGLVTPIHDAFAPEMTRPRSTRHGIRANAATRRLSETAGLTHMTRSAVGGSRPEMTHDVYDAFCGPIRLYVGAHTHMKATGCKNASCVIPVMRSQR